MEGLTMASTTIHTLSYKMVADTQQFTRGLVQSKSEVAMLKKIMGDTTPEQKSAKALASLQRLYETGKLSQEQYKDASAKVRAELQAISRVGQGSGDNLKKFESRLKGIAAGFISIQAARSGVNAFTNMLQRLDDQQDNAERFGMFVDDFIKMQYALERGGDLGQGGAAGAIKTMRDNIELAAMDMGRFKELFSELGADQGMIAAVAAMPVQKQFETMIDIINKIPDAGKRGLITSKLFGTDEGQMASLVNNGVEGIQKLYDEAKQFGLLQGSDAAAIEKAAEAWKDVGFRWQGVVKELTVAMMPVAEKLMQATKNILGTTELPKTDIRPISDAKWMSMQENVGMNRFTDNKGSYFRTVRGNLNQRQLEDFFHQAKQLDPNFARATLLPEQERRLFKSSLPGNPEGNQQQVQLMILEELKRQTQASEEMLRQRDQKDINENGLIN